MGRREVNALRTGVRRKALNCYPRLSALRSPHVGEGAFPLVGEGMEIPALPAPCENRGGEALGFCTWLFDM